MATKLTVLAVENAKADPDTRVEIGDALVPGLYLVIQPSGKKGWAVRYRFNGKPAKLTLGPVAMIGLEAARTKARDALAMIASGKDPAEDKRAAKAVSAAPALPSLVTDYWSVVERFNTLELAGLRSGAQVFRALERETKDRWQGKAVGDITRQDVRALIDDIKAGVGRTRGPAPVQAARVLSYVSWFFSWSMGRDILVANPAAGVPKPVNEFARRRQRVLEDAELVDLWRVADRIGHPFGPMVQLLILTGCRLREVAEAEWSEIDLKAHRWIIPPARAKNGEAHEVHLTAPALRILDALPRIGEQPRFVLTTTGSTPISGFDRTKRKIDAMLAALDAERLDAGEIGRPRDPWVFHDLRRSVASGLARLRVPFEVVERVLAHRGESGSGLRAVYNRHSYEDEKAEALTKWAAHLEALTTETGGNVVQFARGLQAKDAM